MSNDDEIVIDDSVVHGIELHPEAYSKFITCGSCQWFNVGYKGITCQKTRKVLVDTPACIEYRAGVKDPWTIFRGDKYLIELRKDLSQMISDNGVFNNYIVELANYNVKIEDLDLNLGQHQSALALQKALQTVVGFRFRVSEIYTQTLDYKRDMARFQEKIYIWLSSTYPEVRELKNEKAKQVALSRAVPELLEIQTVVDKTVDIAKYIDSKLDSNDRTIQQMLNSVKSTYYSPTKAFV